MGHLVGTLAATLIDVHDVRPPTWVGVARSRGWPTYGPLSARLRARASPKPYPWGQAMAARPCLTCGRLTYNGARCATCTLERDRERNARRVHYRGAYQARRAKARRGWADEGAPCWLATIGQCLHPNEPIDYTTRNTPVSLNADHVVQGDPLSLLAPSHAHCNQARRDRVK